ncbi:hypothetical protein [Streptomyces bacillaris]|uniref:hypothetical protein n=1 Tax=Streptomyces bacillaris TaxID=68179 RepID=UPI0036FB5B82
MTGVRRSVRPEGGGIALTLLAVAGLVGPAWALREQAVPLLNVLGHQPAAASTDASPPSDR